MLVLTRKRGEQIRIGDDIVITVLRVKGQAVRIGIEAPQQHRVIRQELEPLPEETGLPQPVNSHRSEGRGVERDHGRQVGAHPETSKSDSPWTEPGLRPPKSRPLDRCLNHLRRSNGMPNPGNGFCTA